MGRVYIGRVFECEDQRMHVQHSQLLKSITYSSVFFHSMTMLSCCVGYGGATGGDAELQFEAALWTREQGTHCK